MRRILFLLFFLISSSVNAQALTVECGLLLRNEILADPQLVSQPMNSDGDFAIAAILNMPAVPQYVGWRTSVTMNEIGKAINGAELAGLTTANNTRLQTIVLISGGFINPQLADQRAFFDDVFSGAGGTVTRSNLASLWRRGATRAEKVCATGLGTSVSPSTFSFEGFLSTQQVSVIRTLQ